MEPITVESELTQLAEAAGELAELTGASGDVMLVVLFGVVMFIFWLVVWVFVSLTKAILLAPPRPHCHDCTIRNREICSKVMRRVWAGILWPFRALRGRRRSNHASR